MIRFSLIFLLLFFGSESLLIGAEILPQLILHLSPGQSIGADIPVDVYLELPFSQTAQLQKANIKIRGSSSREFAKKSYNLEIEYDDSFTDLGLPSENDWVLSGPYMDKSLARDAFAYSLGNKIRPGWAPEYRYVHLLLNNQSKEQDLGIYLLIKKINRKNFGIKKVSNNGELNGFLANIEMGSRPDKSYIKHQGMKIEIKYPQDFNQAPQLQKELEQVFNTVDKAINGEMTSIDILSFVDFFIIQEFLGNSDGFRRSQYLHRQSADAPVVMGPLWDFNTTTGAIKGTFKSYRTDIWFHQLKYAFNFIPILPWWEKLIKKKFFKQMVCDRYRELRQGVLSDDALDTLLDSVVAQIPEDEIAREQDIWQIFGRDLFDKERWNQVSFSGGPKKPLNHAEEIARIRYWLAKRGQWLDHNIDSI